MPALMERARFDWLVELGGASALGLAAGYAALKAAPSLGLPGPAAMTAGGFAFFSLGIALMRAVGPGSPELALEEFAVAPVAADDLLLDEHFEEPLLLDEIYADDALLLDDPLREAGPAARVVQLFAAQPLPTPGELKERIDRHLASAPRQPFAQMPPPPADASAALYAALNDLKRTLR